MKAKKKSDIVRISFALTKLEAESLCNARCELKPSTAAAQTVREFLKGVKGHE